MQVHLVQKLVQRFGVAAIDQAVSSGTNFVATIVAARFLGPRGLGIVAVGLAIAFFFLAIGRGFVGEPLLVLGERSDTRGALTAGVVLGFGGSLLAGIAAFFLRDIRSTLLVLVPLLPALLYQDGARYAAFSARRPMIALQSDLTWACLQAIGLLAIAVTGSASAASVLGTWTLGTIGGALFGGVRLHANLSAAAVRTWFAQARALSGWLAAQALVGQAGIQIAVLLLAATAGVEVAAGIRAAQTLLGPLALVLATFPVMILGDMSEAGSVRDLRGLRKQVIKVTALTTSIGALFALALIASRRFIITTFFGPSFQELSPISVPVALAGLALAAAVGPGLGTRALGAGRGVFASQAVATAAGIPMILLLGRAGGAVGATWGAAAQFALLSLMSWLVYEAVTARREVEAS